MIGSILTGTGCFLPEQRLTNQMLERMVNTSEEWIVQHTGIHERRIGSNMSVLDIALPAAQRAMHDAGKTAKEIDMIIACTITPDSFTPTLSCQLQDKLGAEQAFAFDVSAACSGFVYASDIADSFLRCGKAKCVLVVCAELLSRFVDYTDRKVCCLFGDGAGAAVYEWDDTQKGILASYMKADGAKGQSLYSPAFPTGDPFAAQRVQLSNHFLQMDGHTVFRFTAHAVPDAIEGVLRQADMEIADIDWIVPHQANARILEMVTRRYGLEPEKIYSNLDHVGNTSSASIPICLAEMKEQGKLQHGQHIICVGFGGGLTYGAVLICL